MEKSYDHLKVPEKYHVLPLQTKTPSGIIRIKALFATPEEYKGKTEVVGGWAKTVRKQGKNLVFVALSDGSCSRNVQVDNFSFFDFRVQIGSCKRFNAHSCSRVLTN